MIRLSLAVLVLAFVGGCSQGIVTPTLTQDELRTKAQMIASDPLGTVSYVGRAEGYDYFLTNFNGAPNEYRIRVPNDIVKVPMPYNSDQIIIGPFTPDRWVP